MEPVKCSGLNVEIFDDESPTDLQERIEKWLAENRMRTIVNITQSSSTFATDTIYTTISIWYI